MSTNITISPASGADVADILPMLAVQLDEHGMAMPRSRLESALGGLVAQPERGRALVARRRTDSAAIGFAVMAYIWTVEHGGLCAWLDELYVIPEQRDHGIGARLLRAAIDAARADGCVAMDLEVDVDHARAEHLYLRHGFRPLSRRRFGRPLGS